MTMTMIMIIMFTVAADHCAPLLWVKEDPLWAPRAVGPPEYLFWRFWRGVCRVCYFLTCYGSSSPNSIQTDLFPQSFPLDAFDPQWTGLEYIATGKRQILTCFQFLKKFIVIGQIYHMRRVKWGKNTILACFKCRHVFFCLVNFCKDSVSYHGYNCGEGRSPLISKCQQRVSVSTSSEWNIL